MIANAQSSARQFNRKLVYNPRKPKESNSSWLQRAFRGKNLKGWLLLLGSTRLTDFRLRVAQSHLRHDMVPSHWSHVGILWDPAGRKDRQIYEIRLDPSAGFGDAPKSNGLQLGRVSEYDSPEEFPNIACIHFGASTASLADAIRAYPRQRTSLDAPALIIEWLAFVWGAGKSGNPLLNGIGVPCAAFVETAFAITGLELTPGLSSRSSCPEAIWQSAKWWHEYYSALPRQKVPQGKFVLGQEAEGKWCKVGSGVQLPK